MGNTYSQLNIQIVFAVKNRSNLIAESWEAELYKYIAGIIRNKGQKPLIVNGMPDHIHAFLGLRPAMSVADIARDIKNNSSKFINDKKWVNGRFSWQDGYGAFAYSQSQVKTVFNYILNQKEHHKNESFLDEYRALLKEFEINFDEKYLFDPT